MAHIVLISGAVSGEKRYGKLKKIGSYLPPYGLLCIGATLEQAGHKVTLIDREVSPLTDAEVADKVVALRPDVVGMSVFTIGSEESYALAGNIKDKLPDLPIMAGGPHATVAPKLMYGQPHFDYLVIGEGEITSVELVDALEAGRPVNDVAGIHWRDGETWVENGPRETVQDLDTLPFPAFHLVDDVRAYHPSPFGYKRLPHFTLATSRGCPFNCIFCSRLWGQKWRAYSSDYVLNLLRHITDRFGAREVWFAEDTFAISRQRVVEICEGILSSGMKLIWSCMTNIHVLDEELVKLMRRAGCWQVQLGLESGNDEVLKFIRKPITTALVREKAAMLHRAGLKVRGFFILGHLADTQKTIQDTIDFALSLPLYTAEFHILHLPLGSEARDMAQDYGHVDYDLSLLTGYGHDGLSFIPKGLSQEEMFEFRRKAHNRFFLRPKLMFDYLKDIRSLEDLHRYGLIGQAFLSNLVS